MKYVVTILAVLALTVSMASAELVTLQDGLDGYTGTKDTAIYSGGDENWDTAGHAYNTHYISWGNNFYMTLFGFDLSGQSGLTADADGTLTLTRDHQGSASNNDIDFYLLASSSDDSWDENADNVNKDGSNAWSAGNMLGITVALSLDTSSLGALLGNTGNTATNTAYDITIPQATVNAWLAAGTGTIVGVMPGTTNSMVAWQTSEDTVQAVRPKLVMSLVPEPATLIVLGLSGALMLLKRRRA